MGLKRPFRVFPTDTDSRDGGSGCRVLSSIKLNDQFSLLEAYRPFSQQPVVVRQVLASPLSGRGKTFRLRRQQRPSSVAQLAPGHLADRFVRLSKRVVACKSLVLAGKLFRPLWTSCGAQWTLPSRANKNSDRRERTPSRGRPQRRRASFLAQRSSARPGAPLRSGGNAPSAPRHTKVPGIERPRPPNVNRRRRP